MMSRDKFTADKTKKLKIRASIEKTKKDFCLSSLVPKKSCLRPCHKLSEVTGVWGRLTDRLKARERDVHST
jgi:hypothetical protein